MSLSERKKQKGERGWRRRLLIIFFLRSHMGISLLLFFFVRPLFLQGSLSTSRKGEENEHLTRERGGISLLGLHGIHLHESGLGVPSHFKVTTRRRWFIESLGCRQEKEKSYALFTPKIDGWGVPRTSHVFEYFLEYSQPRWTWGRPMDPSKSQTYSLHQYKRICSK